MKLETWEFLRIPCSSLEILCNAIIINSARNIIMKVKKRIENEGTWEHVAGILPGLMLSTIEVDRQ